MLKACHRFVANLACVVVGLAVLAPSAAAQDTGTIAGTVTRIADGTRLAGALVSLQGTRLSVVTNRDGEYSLPRVPAGTYVVVFRVLGHEPLQQNVTVRAGGSQTVDAALQTRAISLGEIIVETGSRTPERIVEAPAAVSVVDVQTARDLSMTSQAPRALARLPGVDVQQSGMNDFNVNARGFNSSLTRRMLVLQDGRDLALGFLGAQLWSGMSSPLDDMRRIEVVRGPGSALYGANAYAGVISFTTPTAREALGTRVTLAGGELSTFRADVRQAGVTTDGRFGYKINAGYSTSDSWTRARTAGDMGDLRREYGPATDAMIDDVLEAAPLFGQTLDPNTRAAIGEPDALRTTYGAGRLDYYLDNGSIATVEGGAALSENAMLVTGIGRVQLDNLLRPWTRAAYAADRFNVMAWYAGENATQPARSLGAGIDLEDNSYTLHGEAQYNQPFADGQGRAIFGASARSYVVDTRGTILDDAADDRNDKYYSGYTQLEFEPTPELRFVGAVRLDAGDLFDTQVSPKAAVVYSPTLEHSVRFTFNRAFQTPSHNDFFVGLPAAAPADFTLLEGGLRLSPLGPALAGVPQGQLFTTSNAVPVLALGNADLEVETVSSFEVGYKGEFAERAFITLDVYYSRLNDFVTDLLPGVNPTYAPWTAPAAVPTTARAPLEQAVRDNLVASGQTLAAAGLTRLPTSDATAIVVSYTNAGKVDEYGFEIGAAVGLTRELQVDANYTLFEFDVDDTSVLPGDELKPNTPKHKINLGAGYTGDQGVDASVNFKFVSAFDWAAGTFVGRVPSSQTIDIAAGYRVNNTLRFQVLGTNILDQSRFHIFGGSVIGRRILGGVTISY